MNPEEKKAHFLKLAENLYDDGEVRNDCAQRLNKEKVDWYAMAEFPQNYTIIERPMVYVYQYNGKSTAITTDELRNYPNGIDEHLEELNVTDYKSSLIEDLK